ncbi:MAG TPA: hypothetical protein DC054_10515 [Blastocatellia bacterium]|nr:hypothetical protein [Blastocatellia bacterium]
MPQWDLPDLVRTQSDHFLLDRSKEHRLAFAVVSISARVWIYTCLRISICKRDKQMRFEFFASKYVRNDQTFWIKVHFVRCVSVMRPKMKARPAHSINPSEK